MHRARFDIAIIGDSLAARMAAALLAKHGKRLLLLATPFHRDPWQHSSLFVEKLFHALGGRDCLATNQPFQVLSSRARVTLHRDLPLRQELAREFGHAAASIETLCDELERTGTLLEEILWEHGGLPMGGVRETAAWRWLCLRRKQPLTALSRPFSERLQGLPEPAGEWLGDLFQGLSLQPLAALTIGDAALLWAHARRREGFAGDESTALLQKRFEQFHGIEAPLENLEALEHSHGQWTGSLPGGGRFQAAQLILGTLDKGLPGHNPPLPRQPFMPTRHFTTSPLDGQLSSLLEKRVIAGGPLPMRMTILPATHGTVGDIGTSAASEEADVRRQLEPLLPFARYRLETQSNRPEPIEAIAGKVTLPSILKLPLRLGSHLWCADETRLAPHLGSGGAALIAWTLLRQLDPAALARS